MKHIEQWIWMPRERYGTEQHTAYSCFGSDGEKSFVTAEFRREYAFHARIAQVDLRFSGDTAFQLYCNGSFVADGPAGAGGDFIGNDRVRENFYSFETTVFPNSAELHFFARVRMSPVQICEFSSGHGGFMLSAAVTLDDGEQIVVGTDETWLVRRNGAYRAPGVYDGRILPDEYVRAECTENVWNTSTAPIPPRQETELLCENSEISLMPFEERSVVLTFDKIFAGYVHAVAKTQGELSAVLLCRELEEEPRKEELTFAGDGEYRTSYLHSIGNISAWVRNDSPHGAVLTLSLIQTHYPVSEEADTVTGDADIDLVLQTCKHTLKMCRQMHHLDSPMHCEPLACTGDYYIESLMTPFSFGDMRLAEFDLLRTAIMLERENGRMFHTSYSLIWVRMLYDVYMLTGNLALLRKCERAMRLLLDRFDGYLGGNGLIESPPDFMFVDWIYIDGLSMHHPPKALGQSCLNMFYFGALDSSERIYRAIGSEAEAADCMLKREALRDAVNSTLFDRERGCYFEGLNTPTDPGAIGEWMPQNVKKRYYLKHSNILAAYFGVCDDVTGTDLIHRIMSDEIEGDCQPYFMHYLLEAVYRLGLRELYTLQIVDRWKGPVRSCPKGLVEGFVTPEPTYSFDHSHAWGGTVLYSLPKAMLGLEIVKPGMKEISLSPSLLSLQRARVELLTPYGKVVCEMKEGERARITHPKEIRVLVDSDNYS